MEEKVLDCIYEVCDEKIIYDNRNIDLFETGLLDSMGFIELLMNLEDEFDIEITPSEIDKEKMGTPNMIISFVRTKLK